MNRNRMAWIISGILIFSLSGCAGNPEKSVVREKNMDKMIQEAEATDHAGSYEQVKEEMKQYETYQTKIQDKDLKVSVDVDAKVEIPEVDKLSVYRVSQKKISQKLFDRIRNALTPDLSYYDGSKVNARTKPVIAKEINDLEKSLAQDKKSGDVDKVQLKEDEDTIAELKKEYKKAPDKVTLTDYPIDHKILEIQKVHNANPGDTFFDWLYELHGKGSFFYGVSDGKDGNFHALFTQNSANYGNCLRYFSSQQGYGYDSNVYHADVENDIPNIVPNEPDKEPNFFDTKSGVSMVEPDGDFSLQCVDNEPLTLSEEDAEKQAEELLKKTGLNDYAVYDKGRYSQMLEYGEDGVVRYRNIYRFLCLRKLDGVFVDNQAGYKLMDEWKGNDYVKKMWGSEAVAITVNDSGIVGFYYLSPLAIKDTVVEESRIKSFGEIKETFEQMVVIENTPDELEEMKDEKVSIKITDVRLVYTRISEKDSFNTGLVVPVWNFEGTVVDAFGYEKTGTILSINAIDGSVIDQQLGY